MWFCAHLIWWCCRQALSETNAVRTENERLRSELEVLQRSIQEEVSSMKTTLQARKAREMVCVSVVVVAAVG